LPEVIGGSQPQEGNAPMQHPFNRIVPSIQAVLSEGPSMSVGCGGELAPGGV
jgi:hypothetical protein